MPHAPAKSLIAPLIGTGLLMAMYLLLRPYGDQTSATTPSAAVAFASGRWVVSHVAGLLAIASFGRLTARLHLHLPSKLTRAARTLGLAGVVLVLPYYGAETFALHAIGRRALSVDFAALELVSQIRDDTIALTMFTLGLLLLAVAAVLAAVAWQRASGWAAWPLAAMVVGILPQFFLPATGRMAFGVLYAVAAAVMLADVAKRTPTPDAGATSALLTAR